MQRSSCASARGTCATKFRAYRRSLRTNLGVEARTMPIYRMLDGGAFDPTAVSAMTTAYEQACATLNLIDRSDPICERIAKRVIEYGRQGELDPVRLCNTVLEELRRNPEPRRPLKRCPKYTTASVPSSPHAWMHRLTAAPAGLDLRIGCPTWQMQASSGPRQPHQSPESSGGQTQAQHKVNWYGSLIRSARRSLQSVRSHFPTRSHLPLPLPLRT